MAPAAGGTPAAGAAPLPRIELVAGLPTLGEDDVLAVPVSLGTVLPAWLTEPAPDAPVDAELLAGALRDTGNRGAVGTVTNLPVPGRRPRSIVAVGLGEGTVPELRGYVATAVRRAQTLAEHGARRLVLPVDGIAPAGADEVRAAVEAALLAGYRFRETSRPHPPRLETVVVVATDAVDPDVAAAARAGETVALAVAWARDLVNTPSNTKTPAWLAEQARARFTGLDDVQVTVLGPDELLAGGFGGVLAVGGGSASPPRVVVAGYRPPTAEGTAHPVVVGKGITFDTGGLSIKPTGGMREMKTDMAGGAAVLAAFDAAVRLRLPVAFTIVVPAAENAVSGTAYRPGDVVRHVGGRTTEVLNTDAEGRMVLADALAYARLSLGATALVDLATLTGAMKVALGTRTAGLYATTDGLADALTTAAGHAGERVWRMPLATEYADALESTVADANNAPGNPGGTTAALFLAPFAGDLPWAHLDIAGPARAGADDAETVKGGSGWGARLLLRWLEDGAPIEPAATAAG